LFFALSKTDVRSAQVDLMDEMLDKLHPGSDPPEQQEADPEPETPEEEPAEEQITEGKYLLGPFSLTSNN